MKSALPEPLFCFRILRYPPQPVSPNIDGVEEALVNCVKLENAAVSLPAEGSHMNAMAAVILGVRSDAALVD